MSDKLVLPRDWNRKSVAPIWKAAAIAGWALAVLLGQCLVIVLAWEGLNRPAAYRPPSPPPRS
ncbi:MAG: hypothetical protein J0I12_05585 [Candidatus Eremiobacteraeota bacterium]|nr:hypothetical protein [Candidatus Eremiobacteraeota bacterium]